MFACYIIVRENCYQLLLPLGAILPKNKIGAHFSVTTHGSRSCRIIHYFWKLPKVNFSFLIFFFRGRSPTKTKEKEITWVVCSWETVRVKNPALKKSNQVRFYMSKLIFISFQKLLPESQDSVCLHVYYNVIQTLKIYFTLKDKQFLLTFWY